MDNANQDPNQPQTPAQQPQAPSANQQPQSPAPTQVQPQAAPQTQPQNPAATPAPQDKPHPVSRIFDGILKNLTGGPVMYTDANGVQRQAPQSRGTMAKGIVAAALAGLLTPTQYREGAFGTKVEDFGATAGGAAQAGKSVMQGMREKPQQLSDEEQSRRLVALTSNSNLIKNMAASTLQGHAALQSMVASSTPLLDSIKEYEKNRVDNQPSALIGENLSKEEAEAKMQGHFTEWKAIPTGTVSVLNPETHQNEEHPTYSIVNPTVKVPLTEEAVNTLATVNPTYKGAWEATNGKVEVPLSLAVSTQHLVNEAHVVQAFADSPELKSAFPDMKQANVAAALRGPNGKSLATALDSTRDSIASGQPTYKTLDAIAHAPNGGALLSALGLSSDKVNDYIEKEKNEAIRQQKLAATGGAGPKDPAGHEKVSAAFGVVNNLPPDQRAPFVARLTGTPTNAETDAVNKDATSQYNKNRTATLTAQKDADKKLGDDILTTPDALGYTPKNYGGSLKEYNKRQDILKKNVDDTMKMEGTYQQFNSILQDINAGKELTGAASVVALFNAIGISATPLAGKGFRINNNTVEEHANSISMPDNLVKKAVSTFKNGEVVTPQQIKDYAQIAADTRVNQYVNLVNQAHGQGLNADFILPTGNGAKMDPNTAKIFIKLTGNLDAAKKAAVAKGWN